MVKLGHQASWHEPTIIAISSPGKRAYVPEICPFPDVTDKLPAEMKRKEPAGLQLRLFQTMSEIASEKNSTIILPVPTELIEYVKNISEKK